VLEPRAPELGAASPCEAPFECSSEAS
jgi:hypothetical protein